MMRIALKIITALFLVTTALKTFAIEQWVLRPTAPVLPSLGSASTVILGIAAVLMWMAVLALHRRWLACLVYFWYSFYFFAHAAYYLFFGTYFHLGQVVLMSEFFRVVHRCSFPAHMAYWVLIADLPFFILIMMHYKKIFSDGLKAIVRRNIIETITVAAIVLSFISTAVTESMTGKFEGEATIVKRYGLFVNDIVNVFRFIDERSLVKEFRYGTNVVNQKTAEQPWNVMCVQVEGLDANIVNQQYKGTYVMPFLHRLTQEAVYYPYALSPIGGGGTSDAEFAVLNSIVPLKGYPSIKLRTYDYPNAMPKQFLAAGYDTVAFHDNTGTFYNRRTAFQKMGFKKFYDIYDMGFIGKTWWGDDQFLFDYIVEQATHAVRPFFYFAITIASHDPYDYVRGHYANPAFQEIPDQKVRDYFDSMSFVDNALERFSNALRTASPRTIVVFYGDHNAYIHATDYFVPAMIEYSETILRAVPVFILTPNGQKYYENDRAATLLDIAPTVLEAAGIPFKFKTPGTNLLVTPMMAPNVMLNATTRKTRASIMAIFQERAIRIADSAHYIIGQDMFMTPSTTSRLFLIVTSGLFGFIDASGVTMVKPQYEEAGYFSDGMAAVKSGMKWGYIDTNGRMVVKPLWDTAARFSCGRAYVTSTKWSGFIDREGKQALEAHWNDCRPFSENRAAVCVYESWGFIALDGTQVIEPQYASVGDFHEDRAWIMTAEKTKTTEILPGISRKVKRYGFIDTNGTVVVPPCYDSVSDFSEGRAVVYQDGRAGFITLQGEQEIDMKFELARPFSEGLAAVASEGKWGFVNQKGKWEIKPKFIWAESFSEGLAFVKTESSCGYINREGDMVIPLTYARLPQGFSDDTWTCSRFMNGIAYAYVNEQQGWCYINTRGEVVWPK